MNSYHGLKSEMSRSLLVTAILAFICSRQDCHAFVPAHHLQQRSNVLTPIMETPSCFSYSTFVSSRQETKGFGSYVPQSGDETSVASTAASSKHLYPKAGDIIKYYDIDGGKADGQWLIGKISFIQKNIGNEASGWTLDIAELEDLGDGFFAEYGARSRQSKRTTRDLLAVSPVTASYVRAENAFKVPRDPLTGIPKARVERYDVEGYEGPFAGMNAINQNVVERDAEIYAALKSKLLRYALLTGLAGTLVTDLLKGTEDAAIYAAGMAASLGYLFLLSVKTDTIASDKANFGKTLSSLRFVLPVIVLAGVAWYNEILGDASPVQGQGLLEFVSPEQFGAATLGFLTYRVPLFLTQIGDALKDTDSNESSSLLPGSAGIALQMVTEAQAAITDSTLPTVADGDLATVLLVSGPQATGRHELVQRLIQEGNGKFVAPTFVDKVADPANFDRLLQREEFLSVDASERYGITKEGILQSAKGVGANSVVVVDADVPLVKQLVYVAGLRLVSVWVGLRDLDSFKRRMPLDDLPEGETAESLMRARTREIVQEIEYGISSGIFEFTILNEDEEESLKQLREAAEFCFK